MRVYIAGPMSGIEAFNIPAFDHAAEVLREHGHEVINPAEVDGEEARKAYLASADGNHDDLVETYESYLDRDLQIIAASGLDAIVTLPEWRQSNGANREVGFALGLGIQIFDFDEVHGILEHVESVNGYDLYDGNGRFTPHEENPLRQRSVTGGVKDNRGKAPLDLIPYEALLGAAEVLEYGARKYKPNNWLLGLSWTQTWSSLQRHLWAWKSGEDTDPETGMSHLDHAMCQMLFLATYVRREMTEFDDRWTSSDTEAAKA